jgi:hypothetical protein
MQFLTYAIGNCSTVARGIEYIKDLLSKEKNKATTTTLFEYYI